MCLCVGGGEKGGGWSSAGHYLTDVQHFAINPLDSVMVVKCIEEV